MNIIIPILLILAFPYILIFAVRGIKIRRDQNSDLSKTSSMTLYSIRHGMWLDIFFIPLYIVVDVMGFFFNIVLQLMCMAISGKSWKQVNKEIKQSLAEKQIKMQLEKERRENKNSYSEFEADQLRELFKDVK